MSKIIKLFGLGISLGILLFCSGCKSITPPAYDVGLKSKTDQLVYESGGQKDSIPVKIDNKKYEDLSEVNQDYLSYHLYNAEGELLSYDNIRTDINIPARGKGTVDLDFRVPMLAGSYIMEVDLVREGVSWYSEKGNKTLKIPVTVNKNYIPEYKTQLLTDQTEIIVEVNDEILLNVTIRNLGTIPIYADGDLTPVISYRLYPYDENSNDLGTPILEGARYQIDKDIQPGGEETFSIPLNRSNFRDAGQYIMILDLVEEGTCWYEDKGAESAKVILSIK